MKIAEVDYLDLKKLFHDFPQKQLLFNEPMSKHTSFQVGGPADLLFLPKSKEELVSALEILKKEGVNFYICGNGSNLLVKDAGYRGVIVKISEGMSGISVDGCKIIAEAGALLSQIAGTALKNSLAGFEFASGIPGSFGGAIFMNAGAYDGEIKDVLEWAEVIETDGNIKRLSNHELDFSYRNSRVQQEGMIVLSGGLTLKRGDAAEIKAKSGDFNKRRREKQPLEFPSAGSTFKRPEGHFAGKLIMDCGLGGYSIGGAQVSDKHCGFIVNKGNATAADVLALIEHVKSSVKERFQVELEPEVRIIG